MEARYATLARQIVSDISSGRIAVGAQLPSEVELASQYEVSRATVRSALDVVEELGLISRKRRAGTRVESAKPTRDYTGSVMTVGELMQYAAETERHVRQVEDIVCSAALARQLGCAPGKAWTNVQMLRTEPSPAGTRGGRPICWTDVYLEPDIGHAIRDRVHVSHGLICEMIEQQCGRFIFEVKQSIRAVLLPEMLADALGAAAGSAALEITRRYLDPLGGMVQASVSVHPTDRFTYQFSLRRDGPAHAG